jgi:hypothetical protein
MKSQKLPVWSHRTLVGHASSIAGAIRLVKRTMNVHPMMTVHAWRRDEFMQDVLGLPDGYAFSIYYQWK